MHNSVTTAVKDFIGKECMRYKGKHHPSRLLGREMEENEREKKEKQISHPIANYVFFGDVAKDV